jgi:hypothetical protein
MIIPWLKTRFSRPSPEPATPRPERITLHLYPDDHALTRLGRLETGDLFVIDLNPASDGEQTRDFVRTYLFRANGALKNHIIDEAGIRGQYNDDDLTRLIDKHLADLGPHTIAPIRFQPFSIHHAGMVFGYVLRPPEPGDCDRVVDVLPGHTLMFHPPWEDGGYAT